MSIFRLIDRLAFFCQLDQIAQTRVPWAFVIDRKFFCQLYFFLSIDFGVFLTDVFLSKKGRNFLRSLCPFRDLHHKFFNLAFKGVEYLFRDARPVRYFLLGYKVEVDCPVHYRLHVAGV